MTTNSTSESKSKNITLWILQVLLSLAFLAAGFGKLSGQPPMVTAFEQIGIGQWFRVFTGGSEVIAAILLLVPRLIPIGALILATTMAGAVLTHVLVIGGSPVPALVLLVFTAIITWGRKNRIAALIGKSA